MAWKRGPLPPGTYGWGGVTLANSSESGFYFADFCGDHVIMSPDTIKRRLEPAEVGWYDNSLELPPHAPVGATRLVG